MQPENGLSKSVIKTTAHKLGAVTEQKPKNAQNGNCQQHSFSSRTISLAIHHFVTLNLLTATGNRKTKI